jgi:hypothetical protein
MTQREHKISTSILAALRRQGIFCFKVWGNEIQMAGLPDILACVDGLFIGFETKVPEQRDNLSPRQVYVKEQIERSKGQVFVVCGAQEAINIVNRLRA